MTKLLKPIVAAIATATFAAPAAAADIVKLVVPFAAGGPVDQVTRTIAPALATELGKTVIVENRGGAGGTVGANFVAKSPPDGATVLMATSGYVFSAGTTPSLPYDPKKDLEPVMLIGQVQTLLVARPSLGVNTVQELIAKAKGGAALNYGSTGVGSTMHVGGELFNMAAGTKVQHVPYKGAAPAITDLLGGQIDMLNADVPVLQPHVKDGRLKALVIYDTKRSPKLPDVPTATEAGLPELMMSNYYTAMVPAGTPADVKTQLEQGLLKAVRSPQVAAKLSDAGLSEPMNMADFESKLAGDFDRWIPFLQKAGIRAE
ncbi:MAG: tripartite tricarboxylate transporter substrate binding protein [Burkholderiaceae bacterium]|nr:tripartite tricarboxylate transporter substrate binding protein [Burkholderiaceae bacterium]